LFVSTSYSDNNVSEALVALKSPQDGRDYSPAHEMIISREHNQEHDDYMTREHEQYMVLYNGNAEVIGNFRALNFYKASDINIKEDVRLLMEGKCDTRQHEIDTDC
jgi:hypothetical protein